MNERQSRPRLAVPGEANIKFVEMPGDNAVPTVLPLQMAGGLDVLVRGGLTKTEQLAGMIAASMVGGRDSGGGFERREIAASAVDLAETVLVECASRREAAQLAAEAAEQSEASSPGGIVLAR